LAKVLEGTSRNVLSRTKVVSGTAPAPLVFGVTLILGLWLDLQAWIGVVGSIPRPFRAALALGVIGLGVWILVLALSSFRRAETSFVPYVPTRALVMGDVYSKSRNPMYQAMIFITAGLGILLRSDWTLLLLVPAALLVHCTIVRPEERYLEQKFGADYRRYKEQVPRYGWRVLGVRR
jgi:protein-S-isoprenylcysteine O-methyltransferase Ste14